MKTITECKKSHTLFKKSKQDIQKILKNTLLWKTQRRWGKCQQQ